MRKTNNNPVDEKLLVTTNDLAGMLSCGLVTAKKIGEESGARLQVGGRVLYSVEKIKKYIEEKTN